jgi:hypothetical protein
LALVVGCASSPQPAVPTLALIPGQPADNPGEGCRLSSWTAPWGRTNRTCLDLANEIVVTRRDIYGFRIEDRQFGDQTWYLVSAYLVADLANRVWDLLRAPAPSPADIPPGANTLDYLRQNSLRDKLYAVYADGELSVVTPGIAILEFPCLIAATQELSRAETLAYAWGTPVDRVISTEIASQPLLAPSLVQLLVAPHSWFGKRVSVQGYFGPYLELYLSREHSEVFDHASAVSVRPPSTPDGVAALEGCQGNWVLMEGFVDSDRGLPVLTRLERVSPFPKGPQCWPLPSARHQ